MYYLPIYVNNRRMYIVKMNRVENQVNNLTLFSFLVDASNKYDVFSLPSKEIQLICEEGENVSLTKNVHFKLERARDNDIQRANYRHIDNLPIFNFCICSGKGDPIVEREIEDVFKFDGKPGNRIEDGEKPFTLRKKRNRPLQEYILQFCYENEEKEDKEDKETSKYLGAIRICEYTDQSRVFTASLDFGSEASQIYKDTLMEGANMDVIHPFVNLVKEANIDEGTTPNTKESQESNDNEGPEYWQWRNDESTTLYKSIYHVHRNPATTNFGDLPMNNGDDTFLQSLLSVKKDVRKSCFLLPNLKLMEHMANLIEGITNDYVITFNEDSFLTGQHQINSKNVYERMLRQILCNFLAVTMYSEKESRQYLIFILLVPNVYSQEKVHKLMEGLYDDFNLLREKDLFIGYKGIEVRTVSESDASFLGFLDAKDEENRNIIPLGEKEAKDAKYLIIDAGKGTTDFSIVAQTGEDLNNFVSLYRSGIPASGHILTYAFYDALRSYFNVLEQGELFKRCINKAIKDNNTIDILNFASSLEQFKLRFSSLKEDENDELKILVENIANDKDQGITHINIFLNHALSKGLLIPGMREALDKKIDIMKGLIKPLVKYAQDNKICCKKVILTGRAFELEVFKKAIADMLVNERIVDKGNVIFRSTLSKTGCTIGAVKHLKNTFLNMNSDLMGKPILLDTEVKKWEKIRQSISNSLNSRGFGSKSKDLSFDFYYKGLYKRNIKNVTLSLNGLGKPISSNNMMSQCFVYYIGDGFLCKKKYENGTLEHISLQINGSTQGVPDEQLDILKKESLFPFSQVSFKLGDPPVDYGYNPSDNHQGNANSKDKHANNSEENPHK